MNDKQTSKSDEKRSLRWAREPFERHMEYEREVLQVLRLSVRGISMLRAAGKLEVAVLTLDKAEGKTDDSRSEADRLRDAEALAALAESEVENGFPLLLAHATVDIWGGLECAVDDFLAAWIAHEPSAQDVEELAAVRVPLARFQSLDDEERSRLLLEELKRAKRTAFKAGAAGFEQLLAVFGLSGPLEDSLRRTLIEIRQVRNYLLHRRGAADRHFTESCPWLDCKVGDRVRVTWADFQRYQAAIDEYTAEVILRVAEHFGAKRPGAEQEETQEGS